MTTIEEDYAALLKRCQEEKVTLETKFFNGKHKVQAFYHEGKVWIHGGCYDDSEPTLASTFSPELMLDLLPYIMLACNKGVAEILTGLTDALESAKKGP